MIDEAKYEDLMEKFTVLKVKMDDLYGNGKPGRMKTLETTVGEHNRYLWMAIGALAVIAPIVTLLAKEYIAHLWR